MRDKVRDISAIATVFSATAAMAALVPRSVAAQRESSAKSSRLATNAWGQPDLQGVWDFSTNTPLQRPTELENRAEYTDADMAQQLRNAERHRAQQDAGEITQD